MKHSKILLGTSLMAIASIVTTPTFAQDTLDEIIVTATKRATGLQDTPIAITAVSAQKLEKQNVDNISEIATFTPNLTFDTTAPVSGVSSGAIVFIRGVGQTDFQLTTDPGVGTYVDGVYSSRSVGGVLDVLDLERVEVLRGPQGTLFGRNTIGGAISLISKRPDAEFGGKGSVTVGSRDRFDLAGVINIPFSDTFRTRISASIRNQDGFVEGRLDDRNLGDINRDSVRAVAEWEPTDSFIATLALDAGQVNEQNAGSRLVGISVALPAVDPAGNPIPPSNMATDFIFNRDTGGVDVVPRANIPGAPTLTFLQEIGPDGPGAFLGPQFLEGDLDQTFATGPNGTELDNFGGSLTLEYKTDFANFKSITAYRDTSGQFARDADGSPFAVTHTDNFDYDHEQFSQELQVTGETGDLKWVLGGYYFNETGNDILTVTLPLLFGNVNNFTFVDNESIAAFAQATYDVTDSLAVTGGIRYTEDDKTYSVPVGGAQILNGPAGVFGPAGTATPFFAPGDNNEKFDDVSYKIGADYTFENGTLIYGSFATGFKSGGFNTRYLVPLLVDPTNPAAGFLPPVSFDEETLESFEVGLKWQGLDNRLRTNIAAFTSNYDDIQLVVFENGAPLTQNAGDAKIQGIEAELTAIVTDGLELSIATGLTDAEYTSVNAVDPGVNANTQVLINNALPNTPKFTLSAALDYVKPFGNGYEALVHVDWAHKSSIENDAQNSIFLSEGVTDVFNASIGFTWNDGQYGLTAFVDNFTDERFIESGDSNFGIGFHEANFNRPREGGVKLKASF